MRKRITSLDDLLKHADAKPNGCRLWSRCTNRSGYGMVKWQGRMWRAHRLAWTLAFGEIPNDQCVCHACDVTGCIEPSHLFLGTNADNSADMKSKGRGRNGRLAGEHHGSAKLSEARVVVIRALLRDGLSLREIAARFGVGGTTIHDIKHGKRWVARAGA